MKKILLGILAYIVFLILYFLQTNFFSWFTIAGVAPNLFIIFILLLGLFTDNIFSIILGLIAGITLDFAGAKTIGITALMFCTIAIIASYFDKNFSKENKISIIVMIVGMTVVFEGASYFLNAFIMDTTIESVAFLKILAIEVIYNVILSLIFYGLIMKAGYKIEQTFKHKNILTRYF